MAEETGNPVIDAGQFLGEDGALSENWLEQAYGDADPMRSDPTLRNTKNIRSMASQLVNAQKQLGQLSGGREFAILPNDQSDDAERATFHTKCGRPETAAEYKLSERPLPEGLPKDEKLAEFMGNVLHKAGAPASLAGAVHDGYAQYIKESLESAATQDKLDDAAANKEIRAKFGAAYEEKMRDAVLAVSTFGAPINAAEADAMIKELPYDSFAAQLLASIGAIISEKGGLHGTPAPAGTMTPVEAKSEIDKTMRDPYYTNVMPEGKPRNQAYHDQLVNKVAELTKLATAGGG